jgi:hypothetical protein
VPHPRSSTVLAVKSSKPSAICTRSWSNFAPSLLHDRRLTTEQRATHLVNHSGSKMRRCDVLFQPLPWFLEVLNILQV